MNINQINILALAYLGDAVYELEIRSYFINSKIYKVNNLQKNTLKYVSAVNQCKYIHYLLDNNLLTDEEKEITIKGRNSKVYSHPKNVDIITYKWATALECLFGYLSVLDKKNRIKEIIELIMEARI